MEASAGLVVTGGKRMFDRGRGFLWLGVGIALLVLSMIVFVPDILL